MLFSVLAGDSIPLTVQHQLSKAKAWRGLCMGFLHKPCQRIYKVEAGVRRTLQ